jgi:hypothetical protein
MHDSLLLSGARSSAASGRAMRAAAWRPGMSALQRALCVASSALGRLQSPHTCPMLVRCSVEGARRSESEALSTLAAAASGLGGGMLWKRRRRAGSEGPSSGPSWNESSELRARGASNAARCVRRAVGRCGSSSVEGKCEAWTKISRCTATALARHPSLLSPASTRLALLSRRSRPAGSVSHSENVSPSRMRTCWRSISRIVDSMPLRGGGAEKAWVRTVLHKRSYAAPSDRNGAAKPGTGSAGLAQRACRVSSSCLTGRCRPREAPGRAPPAADGEQR